MILIMPSYPSSVLAKIEAMTIKFSKPGAMITTHQLELPLSRICFHGSKGVRATEVRLYIHIFE